MPTYSDGEPFAHAANFKKWLAPFIGQPVSAVEIGSHEGRSALWLMDNILTHPQSCLHCIDTWEGEEVQKQQNMDFVQKERNFLANTQVYRTLTSPRDYGRIKVWKGKSEDMVSAIPSGISFCYIDGSHIAADVLTDTVQAWKILKQDGRLIWDDYNWTEGAGELHRPKIAIDSFLNIYKERLELLDMEWVSTPCQVAVRKK